MDSPPPTGYDKFSTKAPSVLNEEPPLMPRPDADRNLLFGILALQMDLITRDALIAAMATWATAKHRSIGEILVEAGALDPSDRADLEPMIDRRIVREGGDPAKSLAALSSIGSVAEEIRRSIADPDVLESIAYVTRNDFDPDATRAPEPNDQPTHGVRYQKVRDHARGGLGVVFVARDAELNREVALKEIQDRHADNPHSRARFLIEAEITGGLEHPGIVPVYGLGSYEDGRPFYAMRFIRGDSLKDVIAAFHADETLKNDPGARTLELQKLLRRFLDVCNAIGYAHSRGVLHRDLKPDNVMVGNYGETLVVDWGLAKAGGLSGGEGETTLPEETFNPASASGSDQTLPGSVIGTPAYMSPEQAEGRVDLLGPASDVYSLGATLYALLTGCPPFIDKNIAEVLRKVKHGEYPRPREASPWLDRGLQAICLKAMALRPADRYASPRALVEDLERSLADEPVKALPEGLSLQIRRWVRRNPSTGPSFVFFIVNCLFCDFIALAWLIISRTGSDFTISYLPIEYIRKSIDSYTIWYIMNLAMFCGIGVQCGFMAGGVIGSFVSLIVSWKKFKVARSFIRGAVLGGISGGIFYPVLFILKSHPSLLDPVLP
jgi:serine/threonine protein kinase